MFESIIYPSAGISHNYEAYSLVLTSGTTVNGLITSETNDSISIKSDDAIVRTFKMAEVDEKLKQKISLMPADLQKVMTAQEIADVGFSYALTAPGIYRVPLAPPVRPAVRLVRENWHRNRVWLELRLTSMLQRQLWPPPPGQPTTSDSVQTFRPHRRESI
jgi:hypothetical protein